MSAALRELTSHISNCAKSGEWQNAILSLHRVLVKKDNFGRSSPPSSSSTASPDDAIQVDTRLCNVVLSACASAGMWKQVDSMMEGWQRQRGMWKNVGPDVRPDVVSYTIAIHALRGCGGLEQGMELFKRMKRNDVHPNIRTYNALLAICAKTGMWSTALSIQSKLKKDANVEADIISYNTVLHALAQGSQWQLSVALLKEMLLVDNMDSGFRAHKMTGRDKVLPTVASFTSGITACRKAGNWQQALKLRDDMLRLRIKPNLFTYNALISACERSGQWQEALNIFDELSAANVPSAPSHSGKHDKRLAPDVISYNALISAFGKGQQWERAMNLIRTMESHGHTSHPAPNHISYCSAISACASAAQWRPAIDILRQLERSAAADVIAYNATMTACERAGQWQEALHILHSMPPGLADTISYNACISSLEKGKGADFKLALGLLKTMRSKNVGFSVISLNATLSTLGKHGQWTRALNLLAAMEDGQFDKVRPDTVSYNAVISACENRRMWQPALALLHRMRRPPPDVISYNACISACEKGGQWRVALDLLAAMENGNPKIEPNEVTLSAVISALAREADQWSRALSLLNSFEDRNLPASVVAYNATITACCEGGQSVRVLELLHHMDSVGITPTVISCNAAFDAIYAAPDCDETYIEYVESVLGVMGRCHIRPDALSYAKALRILRKSDSGVRNNDLTRRLLHEATAAAAKWADGTCIGPTEFAKTAYDIIHLCQILQQCGANVAAFETTVRNIVFQDAYPALKNADVSALTALDLPNVGPFTRELLDLLGFVAFDTTYAQTQVENLGAVRRSNDIAAKEVVAHVRSDGQHERVVWYGGDYMDSEGSSIKKSRVTDRLPTVYLNHDRSQHAERQAMLQLLDVDINGGIQLYITHRPCLSCICAMVAFRKSTKIQLQVAFDELDAE